MGGENKEKLSLEELAQLMKQARKSKEQETGKKITHKMIAEAIGVDRVTVAMWEQGKKHPGFLNIFNYCTVLGITPDELLGLKHQRTLHIELTEGEREAILAMLEECQQESEPHRLHDRLQAFDQYLRAFFSRAQSK